MKFFPVLLCAAVYLSPLPLNGQITSAGHVQVVQTDYEVHYADTTIRDNIFIFCGAPGSLKAGLEEAAGNLSFQWSVYDSLLEGYGEPFITGQGDGSTLTDAQSGGYQVRVTGENGLDTLFRAWVFVNSFRTNIQVARHDCQVLDLAGTADIDTFYYFDPRTYERLMLPPEIDILWSADPFIPVSSAGLNPRIWNPPPVTTGYKLRVAYYSCEAVYAISEDPITTRAEFAIDPPEGEAPLEARFDALSSLNAGEFHWYFDYTPNSNENVKSDDTSPQPVHTYYIPGEYRVTLRTVAGLCDDTFTHPEPVRVYPSELEVPNVFAPGGDPDNDGFMVRAVSMRDFSAVIFNRDGRKVYQWTDPSAGWDGTIGGSTPASPGVYFYEVTGTGWDDRKYEFTGPLYLYRGR
jgi:gliding motility-associated-like protein